MSEEKIVSEILINVDSESDISSKEIRITEKDADSSLQFLEDHEQEFKDVEFTAADEKELSKNLYLWLFPLIFVINTILFVDKATLSYSSILGLFESTNINSAQYDDLNSIFYTGYTIGQLLNFVLQKSNMAKYMTYIIFSWSIIVFCHCGAYNFGGLIVLRFILGLIESTVVPALEVTMLQFFTPKQRATLQPVFWVSCVGSPVIIAGFIAYGVLWAKNTIAPWKIFMIITGGSTFFVAIWVALFYPSDPVGAKFLSNKQKYFLIKKIQGESKASIVQHVVKKEQIIECIKDPISWLFTFFSFFLMLANNLNYQQNLLYVSLGVTNLGSTLVSVAGGGFSSVFHLAGAAFIYFRPNSSALITTLGCIPSVAGGIAMITIPWGNKMGLLACLVLAANTYGIAYIVGLGWATSSCSGNTKRFFRQFMFMIAYGIANIISPQLWKGNQGNDKDGVNRYYAAWVIQIVLAWIGTPVIAWIIHFTLKSRNKKRLATIEAKGKESLGAVVKTDGNGHEIIDKVNIANLDLTDLENKSFIYPL
ncbi:hypothetical protein DASC09_026310 [Saccharomycopsis crataegensis]|uniref:Uncharacterized protein n=1 Tax=Saccharomycopsis crataegensis TaxID=43959 RepID=A0AAV5QKU7_9ASCO|nr:hypothetical protein DASC09_026310 [Saccharomycopsis crataegensis]